MTYYEKLQDPRWQKKRLEIMKRAGFSCEKCGSSSETLHVHHGYYAKSIDPWEYPNDTLWCLCGECHIEIEEIRDDIYSVIARIHPEKLFDIFMDLLEYQKKSDKDSVVLLMKEENTNVCH